MQSCDGVIHLAGQFSLWPRDYPRLYRANVEGTENMLAEAMDAGRPRFVFVSTAGTLGISETAVVRDETAPYNLAALNAPYHQTKLLAEQNLGPGLLRPVAAMAAVVNRVVPLPSFVSPQFAAISTMWAYYSSTKAERELGYRRTPFGEAVHVTLEWYRKEGYVR